MLLSIYVYFSDFQDGVTCVMEAARNGFVNIVEMMLDHSGVFPQPPRAVSGAAMSHGDKGSPPVPPPPPPTPTASTKVRVFLLYENCFTACVLQQASQPSLNFRIIKFAFC